MLVSIRLLTKVLSPSEVGNYYIALTILAFFNLALLNPIGMYFTRNLLQWQKSRNLINALFVFILFMFFVALLAIPVIGVLFEVSNYGDKFDLILFIVFIVLAITVSASHRNILSGVNTLGFRKQFVIIGNATLILGLICSILFINFFGENSILWLFGVITSEIALLYFSFKIFKQDNKLDYKKIRDTFTKAKIIEISKFCIPIGISTILMWGQSMSYRFIVDYKYSAETLGFIAVGLGVSSAVFSSIESISTQYFNPIFLKNILNTSVSKRAQAWNNMASFLIPIYIFTLIFVVMMAQALTVVLLDSKFHESFIFTMIGASIEFFRVNTNLLNNISQSERNTFYSITPYLIGLTLTTGILIIFDLSTSLFLIPCALSLAYFASMVFMFIQMKKLLNVKIEIDVFYICILCVPFGLIFLIPVNLTFMNSFILLSVFGGYFILSILLYLKKLNKNTQFY